MMHIERSRKLLFVVISLFGSVSVLYGQTRWVGSWAASQQLVEPINSLSNDDLRDTTLRQVVHLSLGGTRIRVHVSNNFGGAPLYFSSVHVALAIAPGSMKIDPATDKALTFSGAPDVTVPAGADYVSDPIEFAAPPSDLAISLYLEHSPMQQTGHPGSRATSYVTHGDLVSAVAFPDAKKTEHWYFISGVDVEASEDAAAIVVLGDSLTDGHGATTDANNRWPDVLAQRLRAAPTTRHVAVLNQGIGGNRVLLDGIGPNAMARFERDMLAQPGVRFLLLLEGVNDLGMLTRDGEVSPSEHKQLVHSLTTAYQQMITRAHAHGIKAIGCTIMPFSGFTFYHPGPRNEADRQAVNAWIRALGHFDAVIDFDAVVRDPGHGDRLLPKYDSGDHLHLSPAGYAAMGNAVPLTFFSSGANAEPQIAFTFDDLPAHGPLPPGETRLDVITKIISALHHAGAPATYGFVNGQAIETDPTNFAVLKAWHDAGFPLGNHTWSHINLNQHTLEEFEADTIRNEPLLNSIMKSEDWRWFRFPFLAEGDTADKKAAVRDFLAQRGYKVGGVTMSFDDYMWNEPYARCEEKSDESAIVQLENSYLAAAADAVSNQRELSQRLYGRDIPYVLLMHVGAFDAEMLPKLMEQYRAEGFEFITLQQAESDDFYRNDIDLKLSALPDSLEQAAAERGMLFTGPTSPQASLDKLCR